MRHANRQSGPGPMTEFMPCGRARQSLSLSGQAKCRPTLKTAAILGKLCFILCHVQ